MSRLKITLELTERQADALVVVTDLAYRVAAGQWRDLADFVGQNNSEAFEGAKHWGALGGILEGVAMLALPGKGPAHAAYGIHNKVLHERIRNLDAVGRVLQHALRQHRDARSDRPTPLSDVYNCQQDGEPLPTVRIEELPE